MKINRINSFDQVEALNRYSGASSVESAYRFQETFNFSELPNYSAGEAIDAVAMEKLSQILFKLMFDALVDGCRIVSRNPLGNKDYIIEASFLPPVGKTLKPSICLPLLGVVEEVEPVNHLISIQRNRVAANLERIIYKLTQLATSSELIKLILLFSHEYGHFLSFLKRNHDADLKLALSLFYSKAKFTNKADHYAYVIFREEVNAWRFAEEKLTGLQFTYQELFNDIKYKSLAAYYQQLNLASARVETCGKLSLFALDFERLYDLVKEHPQIDYL